MTTGEGAEKRSDGDREANDRRGERIGIGGGDDSVTRIQLAARWAEAYGPSSDSLGGVLKRFRAAYEYLDSVTHGIEPIDVESEVADTRLSPKPVAAAPAAPPPPAPPAPAPQPEPRPWA